MVGDFNTYPEYEASYDYLLSLGVQDEARQEENACKKVLSGCVRVWASKFQKGEHSAACIPDARSFNYLKRLLFLPLSVIKG